MRWPAAIVALMSWVVTAIVGVLAVTSPAPALGVAADTAVSDADLDVVLHQRGSAFVAARARLDADPERSQSLIVARLTGPPPPSPADEAGLWRLLAGVAPPEHVARVRAELRPIATPQLRRPALLWDPRTDRHWRARDRKLTKGVIATGVLFGAATLGVILWGTINYAIEAARPPQMGAIDGYPIGILMFLMVAPVAAIPITAVGGARLRHRHPLRAYKASLAAGGFVLRF